MIRLADYVFGRLADWGVRHVFLVTGGGAMHLNDAIGKEKRIQYICNHHEQASAMAAEAYARFAGGPGVLCVTSGPGSTNALTGVLGAWTDSIPMLVISGQVKRETCVRSYPGRPLRQLGDQEMDITRMVDCITKYAQPVWDPLSIRYHLEKAFFLASHGRPGPCWLEIPLDVQGSPIDPEALEGFSPEREYPAPDVSALPAQCAEILERLRNARRPVMIAGSGIRFAGALGEFESVIRKLNVPIVLSRSAFDLLPWDDPLRCGRAGIDTDRAGNIAVQNADVLLIVGSRLGIRQVSYNWQAFASKAFKYQVDIDAAELDKPTVKPDIPLLYDAKVFLAEFARQMDSSAPMTNHQRWLNWCREKVCRYPGVLPGHRKNGSPINPYHFIELLFDRLGPDDIIACANGAAFIMTMQAGRIRDRQRLIFNTGTESMGYDLPAAIGAAVAMPGRRVICMAGEGSIQMNIQELQTIVHHQLPVKIVVLNNGGYLSIRSTQRNFFNRLMGAGPESGVSFPDMARLAEAYGIPAVTIERPEDEGAVRKSLDAPGPALLNVLVDPDQGFEPRSASKQLPDGRIVSPPPEDMYPFLDRKEFEEQVVYREP